MVTIDAARSRPAPDLRHLACLGVGVGAVLLGLLPWLVTGMRLPLQYLWATATLPEEMPIGLLPFSQYAITLLFGIIVTAHASAAIVARIVGERRPRFGLLVLAGTIVVLHVAAAVQTSVVLIGGLENRAASAFYLAAVLAVVAVAEIVGLLILSAIARGSRPVAVVALAVAALTAGFWLNGLIAPLGRTSGDPTTTAFLLGIARWVPAILVGLAVAWGGIRSAGRISVGRIVAAVIAFLLLWIVPALATAVSAAAGSYVMLPRPLEMLDFGWSVLRQAMFMPELVVPSLLVAIVIAAVGIAVHELTRRPSPEPSAEPTD